MATKGTTYRMPEENPDARGPENANDPLRKHSLQLSAAERLKRINATIAQQIELGIKPDMEKIAQEYKMARPQIMGVSSNDKINQITLPQLFTDMATMYEQDQEDFENQIQEGQIQEAPAPTDTERIALLRKQILSMVPKGASLRTRDSGELNMTNFKQQYVKPKELDEPLSSLEETFVWIYCSTGDPMQALTGAGYRAYNSNSAEWKRGHLIKHIRKYNEMIAKEGGIGPDRIRYLLSEIAEGEKTERLSDVNINHRIKALDMLAKMSGMYIERCEVTGNTMSQLVFKWEGEDGKIHESVSSVPGEVGSRTIEIEADITSDDVEVTDE